MWSNFVSADSQETLLLLLACLPTLLLAAPALGRIVLFRAKTIDVFSPIYIAAGCVFIGTTLRVIYLLFDPEAPQKMSQVLGPFDPADVLLNGLLIINLGVVAWIFGFAIPVSRARPRTGVFAGNVSAAYVVVPVAAVCLLANLVYLYQIGFVQNFSQLGLSAKRFFALDGGEGRETTFQFLKIGSDIAFAVLVAFAVSLIGRKTRLRERILFWALVVLALTIPVVASVRGEIIYLAIAVLLIRHYSGRRIGLRVLAILFLCAMALLTYLEILRQQARIGDRADEFKVTRIVHTLVYTAHFVGAGKTSAIVEKFPDEFDYLYGSSYATILIAPIPRVLWPEKPVVRVGLFVGTEVLERNSRTGVVPGIIGEAYMNFGSVGVAVILFLFGLFCKVTYTRFALSAYAFSPYSLGFYAILWIFMIDMFTSDFTGSMARFLRVGVPYLLMVFLINLTSKRQTPHRFAKRTMLKKA